MILTSAYSLVAGSDYTVTVGGGGAGNPNGGGVANGSGGTNSAFEELLAIGGGYGGATTGGPGGSGGGGGYNGSPGGAATSGQGYKGGTGAGNYAGRGGGGAGGQGVDGGGSSGSAGGPGFNSSISGTGTWYAGGGGGGSWDATKGMGGSGIGGNGGQPGSANGGNGAANTGSGGGGGGAAGAGGSGGSGIVIVRYPYDPGTFSIALSSPANAQIFSSTAAVSATANVFAAAPPCTVKFYLDSTLVSTTDNAPTTVTVALGVLPLGSHTLYATATDSTSTTVSSGIHTFTVDGTPPTLAASDIVDNRSGGPVQENTTLVTYTVTFSEDMDASTVSADDFGNAGSATLTIGTVAETTPGVFTVPVMPTTVGTLQLQVNAGADLKDLVGNALDTTSAIADDTTLTVNPDTTAPTPDPLTWATAPQATSQTAIMMTATTAMDPSGVEYFFECTSGGGHSSNWQNSATYTDTGLLPNAAYTYRVQARDKSAAQNATGFSATASATTLLGITGSHGGDGYAPNGLNSLLNGSGMTRPDLADPSTWTVSYGNYPDEWMGSFLVGASNSKKAWVAFDLGAPTALDQLYLWNIRYQGGIAGTATYNLYYADSPTVALPSRPNPGAYSVTGLTPQGDYDFSSGGWTKFNTTGTLSAPKAGNSIVDLSGVSARYIALEILTNHGDTYQGGRVGFLETAITRNETAACILTAFDANLAGSSAIITTTGPSTGTVAVQVPYGTTEVEVAALAPGYTLSPGATCPQPNPGIPSPPLSTTNPVHYIVTAQDGITTRDYTVTVTRAPETATLVIDLGTSPAGTTIPGGTFIGSGPTNLPLPALPAGSILQSIAINASLDATDNANYASDLSLLLDPTPETPGGDFSVEITNGEVSFGGAGTLKLGWPTAADATPPPSIALIDTKTDADWDAAGPIDLSTTGLFLGNAYGTAPAGGTWSGTITLTYEVGGGASAYATWSGGEPFTGDKNGDGVENGLAFLLGAPDPDADALGLMPKAAQTAGGLVLAFNCLPVAARGGASLKVEHSSDLGALDPWTATADVVPDVTDAVPDNNVTFVVGAGPAGPPALNRVTATISSAAAADGKLFGRLRATE